MTDPERRAMSQMTWYYLIIVLTTAVTCFIIGFEIGLVWQ